MADKLQFSLVSPARELFSGEVDQVDVPGTEGNLGILPNHAPLMAAIRTGTLRVMQYGTEFRFLVQGGFADVTPDGLTILAEKATLVDEIDLPGLEAEIKALEEGLSDLSGDAALAAQQNLDGLRAVVASR